MCMTEIIIVKSYGHVRYNELRAKRQNIIAFTSLFLCIVESSCTIGVLSRRK